MRSTRFQKGGLRLRKPADRRVWVGLYCDEKRERRYHTLGWASEMTQGTADEKRQEFMREINGGGRTTGATRPQGGGVSRTSLLALLPREVEGIDRWNVGESPPASHRKGAGHSAWKISH